MASFGIDDPPENVKLFSAILNGKVRQVDKLINQYGNINICDERGKTPLICAVCCDNEEVRTYLVRMLLRYGSDVNVQDLEGLTALMYACKEHDRVDVIRLLCRDKSTNFNISDHEGLTAIMHAINTANIAAVTMLLDSSVNAGIDLKIRNKQSLNALELAVKLQLPDCCQMLIGSGAKTSSVRDQKGLQLLLEREVTRRRTSTPLTARAYALRAPFVQPSTPRSVLSNVGRDSTLDREMNRILEREDNPYHSREIQGDNKYDLDRHMLSRKQQQRRALTPITRANQRVSPAFCPQSPIFGHKTRLPSIPSGKKLYLVANSSRYEDPQDIYDGR